MHAPGANLILNTDSYKASHWLQYPPRTTATFFYLESRGGAQVPQFSRALRRATTIGGAE